jgi:chromosomal replication initiator protein
MRKVSEIARETKKEYIEYISKQKIRIDKKLKKIYFNDVKIVEQKDYPLFVSSQVCDFFNVEQKDFYSKSQKREIVQARQIAQSIVKTRTTLSLQKIADAIGGKDHATVVHSAKTVNNLCETDRFFRKAYDDICEIIDKKYRIKKETA